ncbi:MAG TPA: hypothetical protein PLC06_15860, partial [Promineifilum sp.]|nr:hypothetical protein [Promineifilum sp.]
MGADDEFIVDGDENGANGSSHTEDANNRTFLILASLLTGTLLLISLVAVGFILMNRSSERAQTVAAIETQNAVILATNAAVTMTIEAAQVNAAAPEQAIAESDIAPTDIAVKGGISPEDATATADALATIAADPTLVAAVTAAAGGA